ncbi:MAG: heterodisulfide reductase-related iron-sulfur binding cluster [Desulfoprunum sp.]|nr:heterodisulfide reductase-related iron-sulfur binding cluster [Desulfoprunum sp.]
MPAEILTEEIAVLEKMAVRFVSATRLSRELLAEVRTSCQAVYLGQDGELDADLHDLLRNVAAATMALPEEGLFTGGIVEADHNFRYIASVAQERAAALSMDRFMQGVSLTAARPDQTLALYNHLLADQPVTGLWLGCCGAPAHWAGRKTEFREIGEKFLNSWHEMGRPRVLTCCSSCLQMFRDHLPEVEVESVWTVLAASWQSADFAAKQPPLALTDPCTARNDTLTQTAVRTLLADLGQDLANLPMSGELTECCGYGGLMDNANPNLARKVAEHRASQTTACFLTYCIMCREQLARTARPALHILDLLFPEAARAAEEPPLGLSERRENRRALQKKILEDSYNEQAASPEPWQAINLKIASELVLILEKLRILEDDIRQVLWQSRQGGRFFEHGTRSTRMASARLGEVTFWLEYEQDGEKYLLQRCWSHRMSPAGVTK